MKLFNRNRGSHQSDLISRPLLGALGGALPSAGSPPGAGSTDQPEAAAEFDGQGEILEPHPMSVHGVNTPVADRQVVEEVRKGGEGGKRAYRQLVEKYQQKVLRIAFDITRSKEDAEDIAQETFVKAFLSLAEFKGDSAFYTWLYRIAYNMSLDCRRRMARRGGIKSEFNENEYSGATAVQPIGGARIENPEESFVRREERGIILSKLSELSDEHRMVVFLREFEGLRYEEIADITGVSKGTVMSRLFYARKKLQQSLQGLSPDSSSEGETYTQPESQAVVRRSVNGRSKQSHVEEALEAPHAAGAPAGRALNDSLK